ncbi:MAG: transglycosylase SLT domain-containing protein [Deltaproteobacteria bacterium]|nr:transglycosylase SLT domain-containing protein [Deltaproteobacteria bacterium]
MPRLPSHTPRSAALVAITVLMACAPARAQAVSTTTTASAGGAAQAPALTILDALGAESPSLAALREAESSSAIVSNPALHAVEGLNPETLQRPVILQRLTNSTLETAGRYLSDRRARRTLRGWYRDANKFRESLQRWLIAEGAPADLVWVAAAESGFDVGSESSAGAGGLWQLMPDTARSYGLRVDAWVDERRDPERATRAAARLLLELRGRFGSWELALAAYNMGYGALLRSMRRCNTNDFEVLLHTEGGLPFETARYVPRIMALALAARNPERFGLADVVPAEPIRWDDIALTRSFSMAALARAAAISVSELRRLNPALLGMRTPMIAEASTPFVLHVPYGHSVQTVTAIAAIREERVRTTRLRFGESVSELAARYGLSSTSLLALSGLSSEQRVQGGTELFVPDRPEVVAHSAERPLVVVTPSRAPSSAHHRVFYRAGVGDTVREVARVLGISREELVAANALDPQARIPSGLWLQAFVERDPRDALVYSAADVTLVERGTESVAEHVAAADGRVRLTVAVRAGDTMSSLAARYGLTTGSLSRINHRPRHATLTAGESLVVWVTPERANAEARDGDVPERNSAPAASQTPATVPSINVTNAPRVAVQSEQISSDSAQRVHGADRAAHTR